MWQEIATYTVGAGVVAYLGLWVYRTFFKKRRKRKCLDCFSCSGCALRDNELY